MHSPMASGTRRALDRRALKLLLLAGCTVHLYGQYAGPPDPLGGPHGGLTTLERQIQQPDSDSAPPATVRQDAPNTVSVAELRHPLSRKGQALIAKAQNDLHAGKTEEARAELAKAMQEPSAVPYAHSVLGAMYLRLGRLPEAIAELGLAVQLLPIAVNYSNLGYAHWANGDTEQGEQELQQSLQLDHSSPQAHYLLGLLLLDRRSRNHEACEQLQWAQRTVESAQMALAVCYAQGGQDDAADRQVKKFIGSGDDARFAFWKRWVSWVAVQPRPSLAFSLGLQ
jgi:tetratricopeptide (TPR) repeat protein